MTLRAQSASSIKTAQCLEAFKLIYIDRITKFEAGIAAQVGGVVHKIHEVYFNKVVKENDTNKHDLNTFKQSIDEVLSTIADENLKSEVISVVEDLDPRDYLPEIAFTKGTPELKIAVNDKLEKCDFFDPNAFARGIIDVHWFDNNTLYVLDYKTNAQKNADVAQLDFYAWLTYEYYKNDEDVDFDNIVLLFAYLKHPNPLEEMRKYTLDEIEDKIKFNILSEIDKINNAKEFPPNPSPDRCRFCPVSYACSLLTDLSRTPMKSPDQITEEDAVKYAQIYIVADSTAKQLKPIIEKILEEKNELPIGEETLYYKTISKKEPLKEYFLPQLKKLTKDELIEEIKLSNKLITKYKWNAPEEAFQVSSYKVLSSKKTDQTEQAFNFEEGKLWN